MNINPKNEKDNIIYIYKLATPEEMRDGIVWYANAYSDCNRIAIDLSVPVHIVTGVVAALSPNNKWDRNVVNARELIQAFVNGDDMDSVKVSTYHSMKKKNRKFLFLKFFYIVVKIYHKLLT